MTNENPTQPEVQHGKQPAGVDPEVQHGTQPAPQPQGVDENGDPVRHSTFPDDDGADDDNADPHTD